MQSPNFISEHTLKVLYGDNKALPNLSGELSLEAWLNPIPLSFRKHWQKVGTTDLAELTPIETGSYRFFYDKDQFNPFVLSANTVRAVDLLNICQELKDQYIELESRIINKDIEQKLAEQLNEIALEELSSQRPKTVGLLHAKTILLEQKTGTTNSYQLTVEELFTEELDPSLLVLQRKKLETEKEQLTRQREAASHPGSPHNLHFQSSKLKGEYAYRFTQLVMCIEAIKHGLFILKNLAPENLKIEVSDAMLHQAIQDYRQFPATMTDLPAALGARVENPSASHLLEPEIDIQHLLESVGMILQKDRLNTTSHIHRVSIQELLNAAWDKKMTNGSWKVDIGEELRKRIQTGWDNRIKHKPTSQAAAGSPSEETPAKEIRERRLERLERKIRKSRLESAAKEIWKSRLESIKSLESLESIKNLEEEFSQSCRESLEEEFWKSRLVREDWKQYLEERKISIELSDLMLPKGVRLVSIGAEAILSTRKKNSSRNRPGVHRYEAMKDTVFPFTIIPPEQYMGPDTTYSKWPVKRVQFSSSPSLGSQSVTLHSKDGSILFGQEEVENYLPYGTWQLYFETGMDSEQLFKAVKDIYLYLNLKTSNL